MLTSFDVIHVGAQFPPSDDERLETYEQVDELLEGDHGEVFRASFLRLMRDDYSMVEIDLPWVRKTRLIFADLLCGEPGRIRTKDESEQEYCDELVERLDLWRTMHEVVGDTVSYGDGVFKLRKTNGDVKLVPQPPDYWFPIVSEDDLREILGHLLAWKVNRRNEEQPDWYGIAELHTPKFITRYELKLNHDGSAITDVISEKKTASGVDKFLLFHAPNWRTSKELFGHSLFADADSILSEMEVRYGQMSKILDKHADPGMYGPESALEQNAVTGVWQVKSGSFYPIADGEQPPGYTTWNGDLSSNIEMIKLLREELYAATDTSPALFGKLEQGMAESGSALKRLLISPLAAVNRLRLTYDPLVKDILKTAAELEGKTLGDIDIQWRDGLPEDPMEAAQIEQTRAAAGNTSTESSIVRLDGLEGDALDAEMERIKEEKKAKEPKMPPAIKLPNAANAPGGEQPLKPGPLPPPGAGAKAK